jgi:hypothetical protein
VEISVFESRVINASQPLGHGKSSATAYGPAPVVGVLSERFSLDVFLSYTSWDKAVVREVAGQLQADGLRVWFDDWEIHPGDSIPAKIEEGLEHSRALVLCCRRMRSARPGLRKESGTCGSGNLFFRDPPNKERHFILLRFDDSRLAHNNQLWQSRPIGYDQALHLPQLAGRRFRARSPRGAR